MQTNHNLEIKRSRSFIAAGILSSVLAIIFSLLLWRSEVFTGAVLLIGGAFFLLIASLYASGDRQPLIELADKGIILHKCNAVIVPWAEIEAVSLERLPKAGHFLVIKLKSSRYNLPDQCKYAVTRQRDHKTQIVLMVEGLSVPPGLIVNKINEFLGVLS